jgi:hypothetical protein
MQSLFFVLIDQLMPISEWLRAIRQRAVEGFAARRDEANRAVVKYEDDDVPFVHLSAVEAA